MKKAELLQLICNDLRALQDETMKLSESGAQGDIILFNGTLENYSMICAKRILKKVNGAKNGR